MIAYLGMYDMPLTAAANDRFWALIRHHLGTGPDHLEREKSPWEIWDSQDLLFAQTCSLPLRTRLSGHVSLVGTPDYALNGCPPGHYRSMIVTRLSGPNDVRDLGGAAMAFNDTMSQSGWAAPLLLLEELGMKPGVLVQAGSHMAAAETVTRENADFAAIDALTWLLMRQSCPELTARLKVIGETSPTPGLPYITANMRDTRQITQAVAMAIAQLQPEDRTLLHVRNLVHIPIETYLALPNP